jgi:hypothetical protein
MSRLVKRFGDETAAKATDDSGGSRSSGERSLDDRGLYKAAGQRSRRVFGTHRLNATVPLWVSPGESLTGARLVPALGGVAVTGSGRSRDVRRAGEDLIEGFGWFGGDEV